MDIDMNQAATKQNAEDILSEIRNLAEMTSREFSTIADRFDGIDEEIGALRKDVDLLVSDMNKVKMEIAEMKEDIRLTKGEQQALRNDIAEFFRQLHIVQKKVDKLKDLPAGEQHRTYTEVQRLKHWASAIGIRAGVPFPLTPRKA